MMTRSWTTITPSRYEHERQGLDFIRQGLPDHEPFRAWSNFEFLSDSGAVYEVDLLVLTKLGLFLIELKGRPGRVAGDVRTWTWTRPDGKIRVDDNPLYLANQKARSLASVLAGQATWGRTRCPFIEALVFLSDPEIRCELDEPARTRVCLTDREAGPGGEGRAGILAALLERRARGLEPYPKGTIDAGVARALARAVEAAGIRPSERSRRVGEYILGDLLGEGPGYQDREARHAHLEGTYRRVRTYLVARLTDEEDRAAVARAARREFQTLQTLNHPGILAALDYQEHELGPCLLFRHEPGSVRLDHFLARRVHQLDFGQRLDLLRRIADAVRYAHHKRVIHRALSPESILVERPDSDAPEPRIFHWQLSARRTGSTTPSGTIHIESWLGAAERLYLAPETFQAPDQAQETADVFSLGAIAYHLFAGRPPASGELALRDLLREHKGLKLSAVLDGCGIELEQLVAWSTHPDPKTRLASVEDFLAQLDAVEEEATRPEGPAECTDPLAAAIGDVLPGGYVVEKKLGSGSTAQALWVRKDDAPFVLKVARTPEDGQRLRDEAEVLRHLRSEFIVNLVGVVEMNGRTVLVLNNTGEETLAQRLEREGRQRGLGLELLHRFGEDLLSAVASLERHGIPHRDIKPDNIAVRRVGEQKELHLVLFDFSLSRARGRRHPAGDPRLCRPLPGPAAVAALGPGGGAVRGGGDAARDGHGQDAPVGRWVGGRRPDRRRAGARCRAVRPGRAAGPGRLLPPRLAPRPPAAVR
jgi:serine/threonine protein kinase